MTKQTQQEVVEKEAPTVQTLALPLDLVQSVVDYIQAVPTGNQPAGIVIRLIGEIQRHSIEQGAMKLPSKGNGA